MPSAVTLWLFLGTSTSQQCSLLDGAVPCRLSRPDSLPAEELVSGPREKPRPPASLSQHASDPTTLHPQADCLQPWTLTLPALFHLLHLPGPGPPECVGPPPLTLAHLQSSPSPQTHLGASTPSCAQIGPKDPAFLPVTTSLTSYPPPPLSAPSLCR